MTLEEFITKAMTIKFKNKGRDYFYGDCWSIPYLAYRDILGVELPSFTDDYMTAGDTKASRRIISDIILAQKHRWNKIDCYFQALDIVLFRFGAEETHLGLMVDKKRFIHCEKKINTVVENVHSAKWNKRIEGVYRLKEPYEK